MTEQIAALPFWQVRFDADGDPDDATAEETIDEVAVEGLTDLVVFSHGWNNSPDTARRLYRAWFEVFAGQLAEVPAGRTVGLMGVFWPSQRWSDEPIPDFDPAPPAPTLDDRTLASLRAGYPAAATQLDHMAALLATPPTPAAVDEFMTELKAFAHATGAGHDDGEAETPVETGEQPRMLSDPPAEVFRRFTAQLQANGAEIGVAGGGEAGLGDVLSGIWHGAKEALRQLTYWQMKNRAGVVGERGLGPFVARLHQAAPGIRVHLVGHSFGARVVSYCLAGLPADLEPSPVKSVTLLQGAFSHFAFADRLPFDANRSGALKGMLDRIDGTLVTCFSIHDDAVGTLYPLASMTSGDDAAAADERFYRWGGMGHDGAQAVGAVLRELGPAGPPTTYPFASGKPINIDASEIVRLGGPPSGAHSDIVHPELAWVVVQSAGLAA